MKRYWLFCSEIYDCCGGGLDGLVDHFDDLAEAIKWGMKAEEEWDWAWQILDTEAHRFMSRGDQVWHSAEEWMAEGLQSGFWMIRRYREMKADGPDNKKGSRMNDFSWALNEMRQGKAVTRDAWKERRGWYVAAQIPDDASKMRQPYLYMVHEGGLVPWAPQQFDLFANDYIPYEGERLAWPDGGMAPVPYPPGQEPK